MSPIVPAALAVVVAYLIGAIPFGYLTARWLKGIDIRTVGSGNIGATNVGRALGFRFFVLVFLLDMLKGLLPTLGLPLAVQRATGQDVPALPALVALATILGHNFPVYLNFRGGKGVATSFGALLALDPAAMLASAVSFLVFLLVTRYVSLSSILAGFVFASVHFLLVDEPWSGGQIAMSLMTVALLGLLVVRHRKNLGRLAAGTEPKVSLRRKREVPRSGRIAAVAVVGLGLLATALGGLYWATRPRELDCGAFTLEPIARIGTGHQRAERLTFADEGRLLAVTCPRYNRLVLYRVSDRSLAEARDLALEGRPVAVWAAPDRIFVLQRPIADARHVEEGYFQAFDFLGRPIGSRVRVGFDPDDLVVTPDGRSALVLTSGHAEGEVNRPDPCLDVWDLATDPNAPRRRGRVAFDRPGDDPDRVSLSASGLRAAVRLRGSDQVAAIDLADPDRPRIAGRSPLPEREVAYPSVDPERDDWILMPVGSGRETVLVPPSGSSRPREATTRAGASPAPFDLHSSYFISTLPDGSALEVAKAADLRPIGQLPLRGPANLGTIRPTGLAFAPGRDLLAVADRSGGVHLVALRRPARAEVARWFPRVLAAGDAG